MCVRHYLPSKWLKNEPVCLSVCLSVYPRERELQPHKFKHLSMNVFQMLKVSFSSLPPAGYYFSEEKNPALLVPAKGRFFSSIFQRLVMAQGFFSKRKKEISTLHRNQRIFSILKVGNGRTIRITLFIAA